MPSSSYAQAQATLLEAHGLNPEHLAQILSEIHTHEIDYADLYFQNTIHESWVLEDQVVKEGSYSHNQGVGVRAIAGEKTGFSYVDAINLTQLRAAGHAARSIARAGQQGQIKIPQLSSHPQRYAPIQPFMHLSTQDKVDFLYQIDQKARAREPRLIQVNASLYCGQDIVLIAASDGTLATDVRPMVRLSVSVIAEHQGKRESGYAGAGGRYDLALLMTEEVSDRLIHEATRIALLNLDAEAAPAGTFPLVLAGGWPGVLLHEAVGHGLEGDFNRKGTSAFTNKIGQLVASPLCTIVDDGTLVDRRGSLNVDDEGTPSQCTVLIENGVLRQYMQDKLNARLMKMAPTGNGRRESYACLTMPRMTNTYMLAGQHHQGEMIESVDKGIFAVNFSGGQVDITSGKFVFTANEAYLIEKGKIGKAIKGATLVGMGPEVLHQISMVGNDLKLDEGIGTCGKEGQSVPVGVGQPSLKVDAMTIGGTHTA
jgi:TldD protein